MRARVFNRIANLSAELHDGLVHLRFDLLFQQDLAALEDFLNVRPQFACLWIDDREFLFDAESECVLPGAHAGGKCPSKNRTCQVDRLAAASRWQIRHQGAIICKKWNPLSPPRCRSHTRSRFVTAACRNLPQLKLSRPGTCSRALRMAISEIASTAHS